MSQLKHIRHKTFSSATEIQLLLELPSIGYLAGILH